MNNTILAAVIPCFNEEEILHITAERLCSLFDDLISKGRISDKSFLMFVDDGSTDKTWEKIKELSISRNSRIKGLKLSRNFGHQYALYAGLMECSADITITIDADLQDDIKAVYSMIDKYYEGYDIVYGIRNDRSSDDFFKKITAGMYYKITELLHIKTIPQHADFRLMSKRAAEELRKISETNLYLRGIIPSLGFKSAEVYYAREKRIGGKPKYNLLSSSMLAIDGITSFSAAPLRFISLAAFLNFFTAVIMLIYALHSYFVQNKLVPGWTSLFISLHFTGGMVLLSLGIIGEYIAKIYQETKHRPRYIVEEKLF